MKASGGVAIMSNGGAASFLKVQRRKCLTASADSSSMSRNVSLLVDHDARVFNIYTFVSKFKHFSHFCNFKGIIGCLLTEVCIKLAD